MRNVRRITAVFTLAVVSACQQGATVGRGPGAGNALSADLRGGCPTCPVVWSALDVPTESVITGGPWTLEQTGTSAAFPAAGYCDGGIQLGNPGTQRMHPYYFPHTLGRGAELLGYFDYRPKDIDEAIVAATSSNGGHSWTFQQKALELTAQCPASDAATLGTDDGQGHPYVLEVAGTSWLYTLDRSAGNVDSAGLAAHALGTSGPPLDGVPASLDASLRTTGLLSPDGIIAVVPGVSPTTVLYLQKQLGADTAFPAGQQCPAAKANHDVTTPRLAQTDDGIHFTDLGAVNGLNDSTDVSDTGTRYLGPRGTILGLAHGRFGLFFSGGNCLDNDSDAFHYLGYAESTDLVNWTVANDLSAPIASIATVTVAGLALPAVTPVVGDAQGWFAGRVYGPSATLLEGQVISLSFAGYHEQKPKHSMGDYRGVGYVLLSAARH